jgi:ABC-2 type transport system ATP-binding protein
MPALKITGLHVTRGGNHVVRGVDLQVAAGELVGLLGPSGSGKTTLMRAVVGVQQHVTGSVEVLGLPAGHPRLRDRVGYVTQAPSVYNDLSITENLRYFARLLGTADSDVAQALRDVDLERMADRRVGVLSGGERSRVSLAVALLGKPDLLVLDEPTVGLDPVLRRDLWALFHRLADRGIALLVSSHVMDEAQRCDRLVLMRDGRVLADSPLEPLLAATGTADVEEAFLHLVDKANADDAAAALSGAAPGDPPGVPTTPTETTTQGGAR